MSIRTIKFRYKKEKRKKKIKLFVSCEVFPENSKTSNSKSRSIEKEMEQIFMKLNFYSLFQRVRISQQKWM